MAKAISFPLEPLHDTAGNGDTGHLHSASEKHEAQGRALGRGRHTLIERGYVPPCVGQIQEAVHKRAQAALRKAVGKGVIVDASAKQHHRTGKYGGEAHPHLVQDDTGENQEKHKHIEKCLRACETAVGHGVPPAGVLQNLLQRRQHIHEDVAEKHGRCKQHQGRPTHPFAVVEKNLIGVFCHFILVYYYDYAGSGFNCAER